MVEAGPYCWNNCRCLFIASIAMRRNIFKLVRNYYDISGFARCYFLFFPSAIVLRRGEPEFLR
jgi:hypothetical protein